MKIKKMNKNIVKNWTIFLILAVLLVLNSCSNFLSFEENKTDKTAVQNDKCTITVSSDFSESEGLFPRAAFPNFVLSSETLYFAEISYTSSSSKKWLGEDSVCETAVAIKNNYSDEIRFVFCVPQETASYTFTLYACPKQTESQISAVKNSAFAQGTTTVTLSAGQKSLSSSLNIKLKPQESSGAGSVKLPFSFDSALGIVAAKVNVTKDGVSDSSGNNYGFKIEVSGSGARLSAENVQVGTYLAIMKFYKDATDFSSVNEVAVNSAIQQVSVYSGMTTDCWFVDGKRHGTTAADGTFTPSALELTKYDFTELYVLGSDVAAGETDGKLVFYNEEHFGNSIPTITNVNDGDGSMTNPFATVQKAVDKIAAASDTSKKYTIYVDGTVTADSGDDFTTDSAINDKSFIYISSSNKLDLTIKGFSQDSKAVLNANQKDGNLNGNVLTVNASNANITLENLTITGGSRSATGGGIYANGNLTLKKCTVTKNKSNNAGGGISFSGKELVLESTSVTYNESSSNGGGIDADGKVTISNSKISNNSANYGGGIYFAGSKELNINGDTVIEGNSVTDNGGGIYLSTGKAILKDSSLLGNEADYGGAIYTSSNLDLVENVSINENVAKSTGGAIYENSKTALSVKIGENTDSPGIEICKNSANNSAGAIYCTYGNFVMNNGTISENKSFESSGYGGGGAIYMAFSPTDSSISCNFTMNGGIINDNMAQNGGAIYISGYNNNNVFNMKKGILKNNKAENLQNHKKGFGGAIYLGKGQLNLSGSAVIAVEDDGNDVYILDGKEITVTGSLTPGNNAAAENPKYTARITPENYTVEISLITAVSGLTLEGEVGKFCVTDSTDGLGYKIKYNSSDKKGKLASLFSIDSENKSLIIDSADSYVLNKAFEYAAKNSDSTWTIKLNNDIDDLETIIVPKDAKVILTSSDSTNKQLNCISKEDEYNHIQVEKGGDIELKNISLVGQYYGKNVQYALYIKEGGNVVLSGNTFVSNFGNNGDGAIYIYGGTLTIKDKVEIKNNSARYGAGFYASGKSVVTMNGGLITKNTNNNGNRIIHLGSSAKFYWNAGKIEKNTLGSASDESGEIINNSGNTMS